MRIIVVGIALLALAVGCGDKDSPNMATDVGDTGTAMEVVDGGADICTPVCDGKQCGPDGCNRTCGECQMQVETCSDDGQCVAAQCTSTKDCPGDLVCDKDAGHCVVCHRAPRTLRTLARNASPTTVRSGGALPQMVCRAALV